MADFNIRTDAVDVEQIMRQIRARIQEKRGVDYTEAADSGAGERQARAISRSERRSLRSRRAVQARARSQPDPFEPPQYVFDANDLYGSSKALVRLLRKLLSPILKMLLNANRLVQVLHQQSEINTIYEKQFHFSAKRTSSAMRSTRSTTSSSTTSCSS